MRRPISVYTRATTGFSSGSTNARSKYARETANPYNQTTFHNGVRPCSGSQMLRVTIAALFRGEAILPCCGGQPQKRRETVAALTPRVAPAPFGAGLPEAL